MWTTSNSHARYSWCMNTLVCILLAGLVACSSEVQQRGRQEPPRTEIAPDAPREARLESEAKTAEQETTRSVTSVELRSVTVRRMDSTMARLAGPEFVKTSSEPLVIRVKTQEPLGRLDRTSSPVIVFNETTFPDTWAISRDELVAFLPDWKLIRDTNTVAVKWLGDEERARTKQPLILKKKDILK